MSFQTLNNHMSSPTLPSGEGHGRSPQSLGIFEDASHFNVGAVEASFHQRDIINNTYNITMVQPMERHSVPATETIHRVLRPVYRLLDAFVRDGLSSARPSSPPASPALPAPSVQNPEAQQHTEAASHSIPRTLNPLVTQFGVFEGYDNDIIGPLSTPQVYVSSMLSSGRGLACWKPEHRGFIPSRQKAIPGDIGIFTPESGFRAIFNVWDDEESIRRSGSTIGYSEQYLTPRRCVRTHDYELDEGDVIAQGMGASIVRGSDDSIASFRFRYVQKFQVGALLAMTSAAELEELDENDTLRRHIIDYAELLYRHADSILSIQAHQALYIITACIRSENWALAAFRHPMVPPDDTLTLVKLSSKGETQGTTPQVGYAWADIGSAEARRGGSKERVPVKDQTLFLRGFKLDISEPFRSRVATKSGTQAPNQGPSDNRPAPDSHKPSDGGHGDSNGAGAQGNRSSEGSAFGGRSTIMRTSQLSSVDHGTVENDAEHAQANTSDPAFLPSCHPSDLINKWLLRKTAADFALCHDEDWISTLKDHPTSTSLDAASSATLENLEGAPETLERGLFSVEKGVATLLPWTKEPSHHAGDRGDVAKQSYPLSKGNDGGSTEGTARRPGLDHLLKHVVLDALRSSAGKDPDIPSCHPGTRIAVRAEIMTWTERLDKGCDGDTNSILRIWGPPGSGKTAILEAIADECKKSGSLAASISLSAFDEPRNRHWRESFIATLVYGLIQHESIVGFKDEVLAVIEGHPGVFGMLVEQQLEELVLKPLGNVSERSDCRSWPRVIVIDGVGEYNDEHSCDPNGVGHRQTPFPFLEWGDLEEQIETNPYEEIVSALAGLRSFLIVTASRPKDIEPASSGCIFLDDKYDPDADIRLFLKDKLNQVRHRYNLPSTWASDGVVDFLVKAASGQFMYAAMMIQFLTDSEPQDTPEGRLDRLLKWSPLDAPEFFAPIDALFDRVLRGTRMKSRDISMVPFSSPDTMGLWGALTMENHPKKRAAWLLLIHAYDGVYSAEYLRDLLGLGNRRTGEALPSLGSLIGIYDRGGRRYFHFYHKPLLDFLADPRRSFDLHNGEEDIARVMKNCYCSIVKDKPQGPMRFLGPFCQSLEKFLDRQREYTLRDVEWWLDKLPEESKNEHISRMFASVHQDCYPWCHLHACDIWRNGILEYCRGEGWRIPTKEELKQDRVESFEYMIGADNPGFPLRPPPSTL